MENYIDYNFYKSTYKGDMSIEDFEKLVTRASIEVKNSIMNKNIEGFEKEVKLATCSVIDILYKIESIENKKAKLISSEKENRIISSVKVADLSKNYANTTSLKELDEEISNQKNKIKEEIENYLMFTGLLNRSVYGRFI